jgi:signal transduction histidine kinase
VPDADADAAARLRHDLRTPLTVVIGFAEILAGEKALSEEQRHDYAARVLSAALEIRTVVEDAEL